MTTILSAHPIGTWTKASAVLYGENCGHCVLIHFTDEAGSTTGIDIHYGQQKNQHEFIKMLKEAVAKLPLTCECCGQEIKKEEV